MNIYYCHKCSVEQGYLNPTGSTHVDLTGTTYQLEKFIKHTQPPNNTKITSVYEDSSFDYYQNTTLGAMASGCTMIDDRNRINIVWHAGYTNGITYVNLVPQCRTDAVKVVYPYIFEKMHSFPFRESEMGNKTCFKCQCCVLN